LKFVFQVFHKQFIIFHFKVLFLTFLFFFLKGAVKFDLIYNLFLRMLQANLKISEGIWVSVKAENKNKTIFDLLLKSLPQNLSKQTCINK